MIRIGRVDEYVHVVRSADAPTGPEPTRFWGQWSIVLGLLTFTSGLFLLIMFISLGLGRGPDPWGPVNDFLSGVANLLLAVLIPVLSHRAARLPWERLGVRVLAAASVVGAMAGFLLVARLMAFEQSTAVSIAVIVLQILWMLWLNRRFLDDPTVPRAVSRFGIAFAVSLLAALGLFGASFAAGPGSLVGTVLQSLGGVLGGVAWLSWPLWFIMVGRHLKRAAAGDLPV